MTAAWRRSILKGFFYFNLYLSLGANRKQILGLRAHKNEILMGAGAAMFIPFLGITTGKKGLAYYAEVHQSQWNRFIHSLFMPVASTGTLLLIPGVAGATKSQAKSLWAFVLSTYLAHYFTIDLRVAFVTTMIYLNCFAYLDSLYDETNAAKKGFLAMTGALFIQEIIGHYLGGDPPSRFEAIPNAILYAPYFAVSSAV